MCFEKKRFLCFLVVISLVVPLLSSCSSSQTADNSAAVTTETIAEAEATTSIQTTEITSTPTTEPTEAPTPTPTPTPTETPTEIPTEVPRTYGLTPVQLKAIGIVNYLAVVLQDINSQGTGNKVYLQEMFSSLSGNTHPDVVDRRTQTEITDILSTLSELSMIAKKKEHLSYIYDQKRALSLFSLIPNPLTILNVVQSKDKKQAIAAITHMAISSISNYLTDKAQNELQYLQDGWELDEQETRQLNKSQISAFNYLMDMKNEFKLEGKNVLLTLNEKKVKDFVEIKNIDNIHRRIAALEDNQKTYEAYGEYWLLLASCYYENGQYKECLDAIQQFEKLDVQLFIKDSEFAKVLTLGINAAEDILPEEQYIELTEKYLELIIENTYDDNWDLRYYAALTYLELYGRTESRKYLSKAYSIAKATTNKLITKQLEVNKTYLEDIKKIDVGKMANKTEEDKKKRKEAEEYNKTIEENRKKELPPVYEAFWLNCNLLFELAKQSELTDREKKELDGMLHANDIPLFLSRPLDDYFWFDTHQTDYDLSQIEFKMGTLIIPAIYVTDDSSIRITLKTNDLSMVEIIDDWVLEKVERKDKKDVNSYIATYKSEKAAKISYGDKNMSAILSIRAKDMSNIPPIEVVYELNHDYIWFVHSGDHFERCEP